MAGEVLGRREAAQPVLLDVGGRPQVVVGAVGGEPLVRHGRERPRRRARLCERRRRAHPLRKALLSAVHQRRLGAREDRVRRRRGRGPLALEVLGTVGQVRCLQVPHVLRVLRALHDRERVERRLLERADDRRCRRKVVGRRHAHVRPRARPRGLLQRRHPCRPRVRLHRRRDRRLGRRPAGGRGRREERRVAQHKLAAALGGEV
eukprot:1473861-Prymnesium_polylepis.1